MKMEEIDAKLLKLSSVKLKEFSKNITKCKHNMLGVSVPNLKLLAKEICKTDAEMFLKNNTMQNYEKVLLQGFVIAHSKLDFNKKIEWLNSYIPLILDWSECDCVVLACKFLKQNQKQSFEFANYWFKSENEFEKRFAIVVLMSYFINEEYVDKVLNMLINVKSNHYYVKMAVAWALSVCFVKFFDKTLKFFKNCNLDDFTYNKTITKCCESFRINSEQKALLKTLKRV